MDKGIVNFRCKFHLGEDCQTLGCFLVVDELLVTTVFGTTLPLDYGKLRAVNVVLYNEITDKCWQEIKEKEGKHDTQGIV